MLAFLAKRIFRATLVLFSVSVLCFAAFELAPGDYFLEARTTSNLSAEAIDALRAEHGLNRAWPVKYSHWLASVFRGQWGESLTYGVPVWPILWDRARNTLLLSVSAMFAAWIIAIPVCLHYGFASPSVNRSGVTAWLRAAVAFLNATPDLLISSALILFAARTGLFPIGGLGSSGGASLPSHLLLPVVALTLGALPPIFAHGMSAVAEVVNSQPVAAARANGIAGRRLLFSYVLRGAANPLISLFGFSIGALLSSSLIVESAMAWPGIGRLLLEATLQRDVYMVLGAVILSSAFLVTGNLVADVLLYLSDPRVRHV